MSEFRGKVVLVTGAGRNIGRAIALQFAAQGARLALNDINPDHVEVTADLAREAGGEAKTYVFDVAKRMPVEAMFSQILDDYGGLDILINNAAVHPRDRIVDMDEWDWHRTLDVNLGGPFFAMQQAGRIMQMNEGGVIINLGAAEIQASGLERGAAYLASKAGLLALTRAAAVEFAPGHVRVNAVCPGRIGPDGKPGNGSPEGGLNSIPQGRAGTFDDVAGVVLMLCSPASAYITGQSIIVDGGAGLGSV